MKITRRCFWLGLQILLLLAICKFCVVDIVDPLGSVFYKFGCTTVILGDRVTHMSLSPDKSKRVLIIQLREFLSFGDNNYELRLQERGHSSVKTIFKSGDIEGPKGRERIVWASDSSQFILLTNNPYYKHAKGADQSLFTLKSGEKIVTLYDVISRHEYFTHCAAHSKNQSLEHICYRITQDTLQKFYKDKLL